VECWEAALKKNRLDQALRIKLDGKSKERLIEYVRNMPVQGSEKE
jgi:hypothetical protein